LLSCENKPASGKQFRWKRPWHILRWRNWERSWHDRLAGCKNSIGLLNTKNTRLSWTRLCLMSRRLVYTSPVHSSMTVIIA
jgi:hypothetical protein